MRADCGSIVSIIEVGSSLGVKFPVKRAIFGQAPNGGGSDEAPHYDKQRPSATMILFFHLRVLNWF